MDNLTIAAHNQKISFWIQVIKECKSSNLTVSAWCQQNGVNIKTYYYWMRKIKREAFDALPEEKKTGVVSALPPVQSFAEIPQLSTSVSATTAIILHIGEATLEIQNGADPATVENTIRILRCLC